MAPFSRHFAAVVLMVVATVCNGERTNSKGLIHVASVEDSKLLHHPVTRVYGGQQTDPETYQYALFSLLKGSHHQCGAVLVARDVLLTAAHCEQWFDTIRMHSGPERSEYDYEDLAYTQVIPHPDFEEATFDSDIMVIKLERPLEDATIIEMNDGAYGPYSRQMLEVVGWGQTNQDERTTGSQQGGELHYAEIQYVNNQRCERTTHNGKQLYKNEIFPTMLCAGGEGRDACQGDSGSPLIRRTGSGKDVLVGIVSWGRGCAIYPGVYTRMSVFFEWARTHICWMSLDPPAYLGCQPNERDPNVLALGPQTPSPTNHPSEAPPSSPKPSAEFGAGFDGVTSGSDINNESPRTSHATKRIETSLACWLLLPAAGMFVSLLG